MRTRSPMLKRTLATGAVSTLALLGTACDTEPPPPPPLLSVNATVDLPDATPGDGICEATPGVGDCTVRAAIDEGNALGRADIAVPSGTHLTLTSVSVTGTLHIIGEGSATIAGIPDDPDMSQMSDTPYDIAAGGSLQVTGIHLSGIQVRVTSGASFAGLHSRMSAISNLLMYGRRGSTLTVESGGTALLQSSMIGNMASPTIANGGTLLVDQSTVGSYAHTPFGWAAGPPMETTGTGTSYVRGSWLAGTGCTGTLPTSMGYNAAVGTTCGLTGPTDLQNAPANTASPGSSDAPSGPLVDAIPLGEALCGEVLTDVDGNPRPTDGDGDGTAACDIGAREG